MCTGHILCDSFCILLCAADFLNEMGFAKHMEEEHLGSSAMCLCVRNFWLLSFSMTVIDAGSI